MPLKPQSVLHQVRNERRLLLLQRQRFLLVSLILVNFRKQEWNLDNMVSAFLQEVVANHNDSKPQWLAIFDVRVNRDCVV